MDYIKKEDYSYCLRYVADFLNQTPRPTFAQAKVALADAGIDDRSASELVALVKRYGINKFKTKLNAYLKAYTKTEKVLQDEYSAEDLSPDYLLINDEMPGDHYDFYDELTNDGDEDEEALDVDQDLLTNDGSIRM